MVVLGPVTVTGKPAASLIVVLYGRWLSFTLFTLRALLMLVVHLLNVWAVSDATAVPGLGGFFVTLTVNEDALQVTFPAEPAAKTTFVPLCRFAFKTAPTLTLAPPTLLMVRTSCVTAADAPAGIASAMAVSATTAVIVALNTHENICIYLSSA